mmetsp:Transcript_10690/g.33844  ORF Transcript_10690/g.33844 Transcript_10690/m.33844 type:complete len:247 (-) Transcript_10690:742-1482(-)
MHCSSSCSVILPELLVLMALKMLCNCLTYCAFAAICACAAISVSLFALSMAVWQNTPVTTFSTAKYVKAKYTRKNPSHVPWSSASGRTTSNQLTPPQMVWKRVKTERATVPKDSSSPAIWTASGASTCCVVAEAKRIPKTYKIIANKKRVQNRDLKVFTTEPMRILNERKWRMIRATRRTRTTFAMRMMRMLDTCVPPPVGSMAISVQEMATMRVSNRFHPQFGGQGNDAPSVTSRISHSNVKRIA